MIKKSEQGKVETFFYGEAKQIMDQIKKIPAEQNKQHYLQIRENLANKFSKIKKEKS